MDQEEELDAINSFDEDLYRLEEETNELQKMLPNVDSEATPFQVLETAKATIEQWEHEIQVADQNGEPKKVEELTAAKNKIEENVSSISSEFDKELQKLNPVVDYTVYCDDDFVPSVGDDDTATDDTEADDTATDDTATDDTATDDTATDDTATDDTEADDTATDDTATDDTATDDTEADDTATDDTEADDTATDDTATDDTEADDTEADDTATDDTEADDTATDDTATDDTATDDTEADDTDR